MIQKAALHGIGEDRTQRRVYTLHGMLGERPSSFKADNFSQIRVEVTEVFGTEFRQFVMPQDRQETVDVLPVSGQGGLGQLAGGDLLEPQLCVLCQRDAPISFPLGE